MAGSPEQLNCSVWLNPPVGVMVKAAVPVAPCPRVSVDGLTEIEKSGAMGALTVTLVTVDVAAGKFASPEYDAVISPVPTGREVTFRVATPPVSAATPKLALPL